MLTGNERVIFVCYIHSYIPSMCVCVCVCVCRNIYNDFKQIFGIIRK
jgi:hypothetical protein